MMSVFPNSCVPGAAPTPKAVETTCRRPYAPSAQPTATYTATYATGRRRAESQSEHRFPPLPWVGWLVGWLVVMCHSAHQRLLSGA